MVQPRGATAFPMFSMLAVEPELFANRKVELQSGMACLAHRRANLLVSGKRGVGKTSYLKRLSHELAGAHPAGLVPVYVPLSPGKPDDVVDEFPRMVASHLCMSIWDKVCGQPFSRLREEACRSGELSVTMPKREKDIIRLYRLISSTGMNAEHERAAGLGDKLGFGETRTEGYQLAGLTGNELLEVIRELVTIGTEQDDGSVVVLVDEANHHPQEVTRGILTRYMEVFTAGCVQLVFVCESPRDVGADAILAFERPLELSVFPSSKCVSELVDLVLGEFRNRGGVPIMFAPGCCDRIYEICDGHPLLIQGLCIRAYSNAAKQNLTEIGTETVVTAGIELLKDREQFRI